MYYYSAHHPTIVSLFAALGLSEANTSLRTIPYYASLVFVELLQDKTNSSFVRFSFRNGLEVGYLCFINVLSNPTLKPWGRLLEGGLS